MNDLKIGDYVRGSIVRTNRTAEGTVLGVHERTVSIDNGKGDRVMLDKQGIENIGMGAKIKARRIELKMSQGSLAQQLDIHVTSLSQWETGKKIPSADRVEQLEKALGISLSGLSTKAFNGVTVSYDPSVITKKPLREKDILDKDGNFKNIVPAFKEPVPEVEAVENAFSWTNHLDKPTPMTVEEAAAMIKDIPVTIIDSPPVIELIQPLPVKHTIQPLDLDEILATFFPRFGNFHADYQLAGALELLLQAEAGNACLDDLRKARAKLDKAIACLEK